MWLRYSPRTLYWKGSSSLEGPRDSASGLRTRTSKRQSLMLYKSFQKSRITRTRRVYCLKVKARTIFRTRFFTRSLLCRSSYLLSPLIGRCSVRMRFARGSMAMFALTLYKQSGPSMALLGEIFEEFCRKSFSSSAEDNIATELGGVNSSISIRIDTENYEHMARNCQSFAALVCESSNGRGC